MTARPSRTWLARAVALLVLAGVVFGGLTMFGWMIDETHFDRPDDAFDGFASQLDELPGVGIDATERWVEAPTFSNPTSWISVTVDQAQLPELLERACASEYGDPVTWALRVRTDSGDVVSLHSAAAATAAEPGGWGAPGGPVSSGAGRCVDVDFDVVALVGAVDRAGLGVDVQAAIWEDGRFALVALEDQAGDLQDMLPLVAHAEELRDAAGIDAGRSIEINAVALGVVVEPGEPEQYLALLSELSGEHAVTSFWADGGGTQIDGIAKVQVTAPDHQHDAVTDAVRTSGLHIADFPVRFLPG